MLGCRGIIVIANNGLLVFPFTVGPPTNSCSMHKLSVKQHKLSVSTSIQATKMPHKLYVSNSSNKRLPKKVPFDNIVFSLKPPLSASIFSL